jgi:ribosomal protein S18 acetylase RimI-like enzyme
MLSGIELGFVVPRLFRDERDLEGIRAILKAGRRAANGTYYVHLGDLDWWLYSGFVREDLTRYIYLWERTDGESGLLGWALFSPTWCTFDVFVHPDLMNTNAAMQMYVWAEKQCTEYVRKQGGAEIRTMWIFESDGIVNSHLENRGFTREDSHLLYLTRSLDDPLPVGLNLPGYRVRNVAGLHEVMRRAEVSHAAFGSEMPFVDYWRRYEKFMRSPVYSPELDLVGVAPDGQFAAFCVCWLDQVNQVGLFEPVGTHPAFRREGLGKAVMLEGMRRMRTHGIRTAQVCVNDGNLPARRLYESLGFSRQNRLVTFNKRI